MDLVNFKAVLTKRKSVEVETPPPAYYFLPFYVDQTRSWSKAWDCFDKLGQYERWQSTIIKYHVGYLTAKYFEIAQEIAKRKLEFNELQDQINSYESVINTICEFIPRGNETLVEDDFLVLTDEVKLRMKDLSVRQETMLENIANEEANYAHLHQQFVISGNIIAELDKDYVFAVENVSNDEIECPLCGVIHANTVVNRASILTDKQQAVEQYEYLDSKLAKSREKIEKNKKEIEYIRREIKELNEKYGKDDENDLNTIVEKFAFTSLEEKVKTSKERERLKCEDLDSQIKQFRKDQKNVAPSKDEQDIMTDFFIKTLYAFVEKLKAGGINLSEINKPTDGSKIVKEGGDAERTRGILAFYLATYAMIQKYSSEVIAPLVIDTPNQQEQSISNYDKIVDLLTNDLPINSQIFVCAMENPQLAPYEKKAKVIKLDDRKILHRSKYEVVKNEFSVFETS
ncbi:hypothetical protein EYV94_15320 [Puteibacter caeruleilacunae]|nr:hypothetical protein EYV94_15320 [Puteibacter caeruleilacunae]